jgi:hypothetical protein
MTTAKGLNDPRYLSRKEVGIWLNRGHIKNVWSAV